MTGTDPAGVPGAPAANAASGKVWFFRHNSPLILWSVLILAVSSLPGDTMPELVSFWQWDKLAHAGEYLVFGLLLVRRHGGSKMIFPWLPKLMLTCIAFAGFDELHQLFIPNRLCSGWDYLADLLGAFGGVGIGLGSSNIRFRRRQHHASHHR